MLQRAEISCPLDKIRSCMIGSLGAGGLLPGREPNTAERVVLTTTRQTRSPSPQRICRGRAPPAIPSGGAFSTCCRRRSDRPTIRSRSAKKCRQPAGFLPSWRTARRLAAGPWLRLGAFCPRWMPMPLKLSDPVSECRRRAADGRRARTAIEIERFLEMERRRFSLARSRESAERVGPSLSRGGVVASPKSDPALCSLRPLVRVSEAPVRLARSDIRRRRPYPHTSLHERGMITTNRVRDRSPQPARIQAGSNHRSAAPS